MHNEWYTHEELERLLKEPESDLVERKASASDRSSIRQTICAFANDLPGHGRPGVIFIGVTDEGKCANLQVSDELLQNLSQMRSDGNILPQPTMLVQRHTLGGCNVAVVMVAPADFPPVRYRGRVFVRVGPTVRLASPEEERRLAERRRARQVPFDMQPAPMATLADLDLDYIQQQYLPRAVAQEILQMNTRSLEEQLQSLRLLLHGTPTWGALIAFGRDPQAWVPGSYVQFLRLDGPEITDPIRDQKTLTGRLEDILRRLDELLEINISVRTRIGTGVEERFPDYPIVALQQFTRNALMHRTYEGTNSPVRVHWFSDRVEIHSPGGLFGQVNEENFGKGQTDYRNPLLAEILRNLGFAQRFGIGIPLALRELRKNGNPEPEFLFQPTQVSVIVRARP